jgi:hypothetical protein
MRSRTLCAIDSCRNVEKSHELGWPKRSNVIHSIKFLLQRRGADWSGTARFEIHHDNVFRASTLLRLRALQNVRVQFVWYMMHSLQALRVSTLPFAIRLIP